MTELQIGITVALIALGTVITRFFAFWIFPRGKNIPPFIQYLGKSLPPAVFGMLLVYCLKNVSIIASPHGLPELISLTLVILLHLRWRQMLISIAGGTVCYMLLVQFVFV